MDRQKMREQLRILRQKKLARQSQPKVAIAKGVLKVENAAANMLPQSHVRSVTDADMRKLHADRIVEQRMQLMRERFVKSQQPIPPQIQTPPSQAQNLKIQKPQNPQAPQNPQSPPASPKPSGCSSCRRKQTGG